MAIHNKIKFTWEKNTEVHEKAWWIDSLFISFPGLFEIIAHSALGSAISFCWMYVEVVRKQVFCEFSLLKMYIWKEYLKQALDVKKVGQYFQPILGFKVSALVFGHHILLSAGKHLQ